MLASDIRNDFLEYFKGKGHEVVESDLLVPRNDPTLLFTGAGMNQFKEQFMGKNISFKRAVSCQKCLRTGDLENVGRTPRHHTFFEMLGNFSFGDYFKKDAIEWAWRFMTEVMRIPEEKLRVSVYKDDEESYRIWTEDMSVPADRIVRLGAKDNFWPSDAPAKGPNGPCGPCSEIFYDWGEEFGCGSEGCDPSCDCGRFVEVWNLVFTEFERKPDGSLDPLPNKNIDTGMGLERITSVMQGVRTNFDTDLFVPVRKSIKDQLGKRADGLSPSVLNLISDHARAATFAIADGVSPSNEKRGYVVRKLIRRAYVKSGASEPFIYNVVPAVVAVMGTAYPDLASKREHISAIIMEEETRFRDTLRTAMPVLEEMMSSGGGELGGDDIFTLVDTYGMPLDLIEEKATARGMRMDMDSFDRLMEERKEQSRKGSDISCDFIFQPDRFSDAPVPEVSEDMPLDAVLVFMLKQGGRAGSISEGDCAEIIVSPQSGLFYAESGGQTGDRGTIYGDEARMDITNTFSADGRKVFQVKVARGSFSEKDRVRVELCPDRKNRTAGNHTATHLLQAALRDVLGDHIRQSGSYVDDKRLRFDFTHMKKLSDRELARVEDMVNGWIEEGIDVSKKTASLEEARAEGALSFFGEKYGDTVRVVSVGTRSKELCGGTHVDNTRDIGMFKIVSESSVASGIRRIEALTGARAAEWMRDDIGSLLRQIEASGVDPAVSPEILSSARAITDGQKEPGASPVRETYYGIRPALLDALEKIEKEKKKRSKEEEAGSLKEAMDKADMFLEQAESAGAVKIISGRFDGLDMPLLRKISSYMEKKTESSAMILGSVSGDGKVCLICTLTADLSGSPLDAREAVNTVSGTIGGGGGGKKMFAQAGGDRPEMLEKAMDELKDLVRSRTK